MEGEGCWIGWKCRWGRGLEEECRVCECTYDARCDSEERAPVRGSLPSSKVGGMPRLENSTFKLASWLFCCLAALTWRGMRNATRARVHTICVGERARGLSSSPSSSPSPLLIPRTSKRLLAHFKLVPAFARLKAKAAFRHVRVSPHKDDSTLSCALVSSDWTAARLPSTCAPSPSPQVAFRVLSSQQLNSAMAPSVSRLGLTAIAGSLIVGFNPLKTYLNAFTNHPPASGWILVFAFCLAVTAAFASSLQVVITFAWNCFFKPLGKNSDQEGRLNRFYNGQAESEFKLGEVRGGRRAQEADVLAYS
jgi:hypothetical protein